MIWKHGNKMKKVFNSECIKILLTAMHNYHIVLRSGLLWGKMTRKRVQLL